MGNCSCCAKDGHDSSVHPNNNSEPGIDNIVIDDEIISVRSLPTRERVKACPRLVSKPCGLPYSAEQRHINTTGSALTPHVAETICRNRSGRFVFTNTVFDMPEDGFERWEVRPGHFRLVSASRVKTFQCKKADNGWHCRDMGLRFAVFEDSGHLGDTGRDVLGDIHSHVNNVEDIYRTRGFNSLYG